jgi:phage FluMu gp28-like protein
LAEKGRRTGITFAEALDDTLLAASSREAGGMNLFYIGDTKEKGRARPLPSSPPPGHALTVASTAS